MRIVLTLQKRANQCISQASSTLLLRRSALPIALALSAISCSISIPATAASPNRAVKQIVPTDAGLQQCLRRLVKPARAKGVSSTAFKQLTQNLPADPSVLEKLDFQPEFVRPVWAYLASLVDDERVTAGQQKLLAHQQTLNEIEARFGVPTTTVLAIWGVESDFGRNLGSRPLLKSLATLSCFGRRQKYFTGEFLAALSIAANGHTTDTLLNGSWAGAFGHTQFMPSTFLRTAVDFDGDGRRDLVGSIPDALASTAQYLKKAGWQNGQPWGFEVSLPTQVIAHADSRTDRRELGQWLKLGIKALSPADQAQLSTLPASTRAAVIRPANTGGPSFIVFRNFDAIFAYNRSIKYALAIAHLADRIAGGGNFQTAWPTKDLSLSRSQARDLQTLLLLNGHEIGPVDGIVGPATRRAVRAEQGRLGLPETGQPDQSILEALQPNR